MRRKKNNLQRADEWVLNSLLAAHVAKDYDEFLKIRSARHEISSSERISNEYYDLVVSAVRALKEPRSFTKEEYDNWFASTCLSTGSKGKPLHLRIPNMDHNKRKEFGEVVWMWVSLIRSKDLEVHWR